MRLERGNRFSHALERKLDYPINPDGADWQDQGLVALADEAESVREALSGWLGRWTYHQQRGDPVHGLLGVAADHNAVMIIVGTHGGGIGGTLHHLLGGAPSVSHGLLRQHRPVLLVPLTDPGSTAGDA